MNSWDKDGTVQRFREYLKIPSVHPDVDYDECVEFLKRQASELELPVVIHELVPKKPVVVITWEGKEPHLPAILLNSHMDVVPVYEEFWTHPPFEAKISDDGYIYARGTQDMKSVGMFHLEAVRRLKAARTRLRRTVNVCFVPDEEIGGEHGMKVFSQSEQFKALNVGFGLDESCPSISSKVIRAFNGEKTNKQLKVNCRGKPGHGSLLLPNTAGEKLHYIVDKFMKYRAGEMEKKAKGAWVGDLVTINLTLLEGGVQINVVPDTLNVSFDIRIPPTIDHDAFDEMIKKWCAEAGEDVTFEYIGNYEPVKVTNTDESNPFWIALLGAVKEKGYDIHCNICPGTTDARFVRQQGFVWTSAYAHVPLYLKDVNVSPGYKSLWKPDTGYRKPTGIEFGQISRGSLLKIMAEFAQNVEQRLRPRKERAQFTAQFANNKYTRPFIYPKFFGPK